MKRERLEELDDTELVLLSRNVSQIQQEREWKRYDAFFAQASDIFAALVIPMATTKMSLGEICKWRLISKRWLDWITRLPHIHLGWHDFGETRRVASLHRQFTHITSLCCHSVWLDWIGVGITSRLQKLDIYCKCPTTDEHICDAYIYEAHHGPDKMPAMPALHTLHYYDVENDVRGMEQLVSLTCLAISGEAFGQRHEQLLQLTNLSRLELTDVRRDVAVARHLTNLTYLSSDCVSHFEGFTGEGRVKDEGDYDEVERVLDLAPRIVKGCAMLDMQGCWINGVFSGEAFIQYNDEALDEDSGAYDKCYHGTIRQNKFHGQGRLTNAKTRIYYRGQWAHGWRHGRGCLAKEWLQMPGYFFKEEIIEEGEWIDDVFQRG